MEVWFASCPRRDSLKDRDRPGMRLVLEEMKAPKIVNLMKLGNLMVRTGLTNLDLLSFSYYFRGRSIRTGMTVILLSWSLIHLAGSTHSYLSW